MRIGERARTASERICDGTSCNDPVVDVSIANIIIHYGYDRESPSRENDLAIVELQPVINSTGTIPQRFAQL